MDSSNLKFIAMPKSPELTHMAPAERKKRNMNKSKSSPNLFHLEDTKNPKDDKKEKEDQEEEDQEHIEKKKQNKTKKKELAPHSVIIAPISTEEDYHSTCSSSSESSQEFDSDSMASISDASIVDLPVVTESDVLPKIFTIPIEKPLDHLTKEELIQKLIQAQSREEELMERIRELEKMVSVDHFQSDDSEDLRISFSPPNSRRIISGNSKRGFLSPETTRRELDHENEKKLSWSEWLKYKCISRDTEETLLEVKKLLIEEFHEYTNRKIDFLLGLGLLHTYFKTHQTRTKKFIKREKILQDGLYFMKIASGAYGWPLLYGLNKEKGKFEKIVSVGSGVRYGKASHLAAFLEHTGFRAEDLIVAKWKSEHVFDNGHLVLLNHQRMEIIIALRGTMHARDVLVDMTGRNEPFLNGLAHSGMLATARKKKELLWPIVEELLEQFPSYSLEIVGHSLGAGAASIMTILLLQEYPHLPIHCHAYGTPCCLSKEVSHFYKDKITTFIRNDDIVGRMSLGSLQQLKDQVEQVLEQSESNKERFFHLLNATDTFRTRQEFAKKIAGLFKIQYQKEFKLDNQRTQTATKLVPPGRIYHFYKIDPENDLLYVCERSKHRFFTEICISSTMYVDHMPLAYESSFKKSMVWLSSQSNTKSEIHSE